MKYLISVIIPCYNSEKTIGRAIDSCLKQTLKDVEIIIINDGSKDGSLKIINDYVDKYPDNVFVYSQPNSGVFAARNNGLKRVNGEYFTFLDSDDYFDLDMFETMHLKAKENNDDLVYCGFNYTYKDHEDEVRWEEFSNAREMLVKMNATLWNKIYKTEWIKSLNVDFIDTTRFEDTSFLYKIAPFVKNVSKIDKCFVHYVQREDSLVHIYDSKTLQVIRVLQDIYEYYKEKGIFEKYYNELEYTTIRYMLGQPFKYCCKIQNTNERKIALNALWNHLNTSFPDWHKNMYLKGNAKNIYFKCVNNFTYPVFCKIFSKVG